MKKFAILLLTTCSLFLNAVAQRQNTYMIKNNGKYVSTIDSADYIRTVQEPEGGASLHPLYPTKEFYLNRNKKSIGYSSWIDPPKYEGQFMSFYINGKKKQLLNYAGGKIIDTAYTYYPNGVLYNSMVYTQVKDSEQVYIKIVKDSAGKELVTNGNGHAIFYDHDFMHIREEGNVKNGKRDGLWSGVFGEGNNRLTYKETYAEGKMLSGESTDRKGNVYHYTVSEIRPHYKDGMNAFYSYLSRSIKYPPNLASQRIQGVAQVSFVILANGEIDNVRVMNSVHPDMAAEAIRVIKESKGWEPGVQKGRKVKVAYKIPVSFSLN
jgi:TonB family protein